MSADDRDGLPVRWPVLAGALCVIFITCAPLFVRLGGLEQRNDEAIYSYAVNRMLETGDWLTPRSIPTDMPFLEKPPLKFWMVAGLMKLGVIPKNDAGLRFLDALMCAAALLYVYGLGVRLSGIVTGVVAAFLLFTFPPLLFEHGIRGNNMEAPLLLAYCGGLYHFYRWARDPTPQRRIHAWSFCGYFFLAFMTKFVAAFFLPLIAVVWLAADRSGLKTIKTSWRDWIAPAAAMTLCIVPWFAYQTIRNARLFWDVLLMQHVITRFAGVLHASHIHPWNYYFTSLWAALLRAGLLPIFAAGTALVAVVGFARVPLIPVSADGKLRAANPDADRRALSRLLMLWWIVPTAIMSFGTSKLFYYSFPFLPPLAVGAGFVIGLIAEWILALSLFMAHRVDLTGFRDADIARWQTRRVSYALTAFGACCLVVAISTAYAGTIDWEFGGLRVVKNSSVVKPLIAGAISWYFAGLGPGVLHIASVIFLGGLLPLAGYDAQLHRLNQIDAPLRAARDCGLSVQASKRMPHNGVYKMSGDTDHPYFYYLSQLGPYVWPQQARADELERRLESDSERSVVVMSAEDFAELGGLVPTPPAVPNPDSGIVPAVSETARHARLHRGLPAAVHMSLGDAVLLFPGEYAPCARVVSHAGPGLTRLDAIEPK